MNSFTGTAGTARAAASRIKKNIGSSSNALRFIAIASICVIAIFTLIGLQAYTAYLQVENNDLQTQNEYLQAEIDSLNNKIVEETKVENIEKIATHKYGMVYPTSENWVTICKDKGVTDNLAATIRHKAYN